MKVASSGARISLKIDRLSIGGRGVGRHEGLVVFVPDVAPGEVVEVELTKVKKNFAEGRVVSLLEKSPDRVTPRCRHAGTCGGCSWQHIAYPAQLEAKRALVIEALRKFSGFEIFDTMVAATVPSPSEFRYRNRIQVHLDNGRAGFHKRGSNQLVTVDDCLIADERLIALLQEVKLSRNSKFGRQELYLTEEGSASIRGTSGSDDLENGVDSDEGSPFSQVNSAQNEALVSFVLEQMKGSVPSNTSGLVVDLYAGNGNFTLPLARAFPNAEIASAELNGPNVRAARAKAEAEFPGREFRIKEADVADFVRNEPKLSGAVVLLDPPRTGCTPDVTQTLATAAPKTIVYVSCHPVTLARDLQVFSNKSYRIITVQPFDMFPQTDHVETVVVMNRLDESRSG